MKLIRVSDEVHARLLLYADGRPLGRAVERLLAAAESWLSGRVTAVHMGEVENTPLELLEKVAPPPAGSVLMPPTLDVEAVPDTKPAAPSDFEGLKIMEGGKEMKVTSNSRYTFPAPSCTCGPGEKAKGKHSKWCPQREK